MRHPRPRSAVGRVSAAQPAVPSPASRRVALRRPALHSSEEILLRWTAGLTKVSSRPWTAPRRLSAATKPASWRILDASCQYTAPLAGYPRPAPDQAPDVSRD